MNDARTKQSLKTGKSMALVFLLMAIFVFTVFCVNIPVTNAEALNAGEKADDWQYNNTSNLNLANSDPGTASVNLVKLMMAFLGIIAIVILVWGIIRRIRSRGVRPPAKPRGNLMIGLSAACLLFILSAFVVMNFVVTNVSDSLNYGGPASLSLGSGGPSLGISSAPAPLFREADNLGFSVGGAKDVNNFRQNITNNFLPVPTDITYEGLYYDYYFDTGRQEECGKLFCPSYSYAASFDPISGEEEYYLSVGLNSGIKESDFQRKKLNLVVVLDISGSMGSAFNKYYYDRFGHKQSIEEDDEDAGKTKMELAAKSVVSLLDHLNEDDSFGMVLFESIAHLAKPLGLVGETDTQAIKDHILEIRQRGGTQMSAGIKMGTELFAEYLEVDRREYENRIIFLTDAMPNRGETSETGLLGMTGKNADNNVYTTFIGIGVDFNTELTETITKIRGANYYSVHSAKEFKQRMDDEFEFMVTPLVFDLKLTLEADGYKIAKVYGSPEANEATGEIMKVNTLFPSKTEGGETRGGLVLLKLIKLSPDARLKLKTSYVDRQGQAGGDEAVIRMKNSAEYYDNSGIRKGIVLARYANLIKNWINDERVQKAQPKPTPFYSVDKENGIIIPELIGPSLGRWERQSLPLTISRHYGKMFFYFKDYFIHEAAVIGDKELDQEVELLEKLIKDSGYAGDFQSEIREENKVSEEANTAAGITSEECINRGGRLLNITSGMSCNEAEENIGAVTGLMSSYVCCLLR